jgi:cytochrome b
MRSIPVWDIFVRATHWTVAALVIADLSLLDGEAKVHHWAGYVVLGLVALRLVWGLIGPRFARFSAFPPSLQAARAHLAGLLRGQRELHLSHNPLGALMVYNLWASIIMACVSGYLMTTDAFFGVEWVEGAHEAIANWLMISVVLHVAGVLFETRASNVNLVRAMITGDKQIPGPGE